MSSSSTRHSKSHITIIKRPITAAQIRKLNTLKKFRWFIETCSICPPRRAGEDPYLRAIVADLGRPRLTCDLWMTATIRQFKQ